MHIYTLRNTTERIPVKMTTAPRSIWNILADVIVRPVTPHSKHPFAKVLSSATLRLSNSGHTPTEVHQRRCGHVAACWEHENVRGPRLVLWVLLWVKLVCPPETPHREPEDSQAGELPQKHTCGDSGGGCPSRGVCVPAAWKKGWLNS